MTKKLTFADLIRGAQTPSEKLNHDTRKKSGSIVDRNMARNAVAQTKFKSMDVDLNDDGNIEDEEDEDCEEDDWDNRQQDSQNGYGLLDLYEPIDSDDDASLQSQESSSSRSKKWEDFFAQQSAFMSALYAKHPQQCDKRDDGTFNDASVAFGNKSRKSPSFPNRPDQEGNTKKGNGNDVLFIQSTLNPTVVEQPIKANLLQSREDRLKPRLIRKQKGSKKRRRELLPSDGQQDIVEFEEHLESVKEARLRVAREDRNKEWKLISRRWKKRKYDYSDEVDVGNAIASIAHNVKGEHDKKRTSQRQSRRLERMVKKRQKVAPPLTTTGEDGRRKHAATGTQDMIEKVEQSGHNERDLNSDGDDRSTSSLDEQKQVLHRLQQNSASQEELVREQGKKENTLDDKINVMEKPFKNQMEYWELGKSVPHAKDLDFRYMKGNQCQPLSSGSDAPLAGKAKAEEEPPTNSEALSLSLIHFTRPLSFAARGPDPPCHFPLSANRIIGRRKKGTVRGEFLHHRQLRRMAARYLCGCAASPTQVVLENRLLRALHSMAPVPGGDRGQRDWGKRVTYAFHHSHRKQLHLNLAQQRGIDLQLYLEQEWRDDAKRVATHLGLLPPKPNGGAVRWAGYSLEPLRIKLVARRERRKLLQTLKGSPMNWSHDRQLEATEVSEDGSKERGKYTEGIVCNDEVHSRDFAGSLSACSDVGVIADQESQGDTASVETSTVATRRGKHVHADADNAASMGRTTSNYSHLAGTVPPVPTIFQLGTTQTLYGPVDRHATFSSTAKLDETTLSLTVSTLVSRLGRLEVQASRLGSLPDFDERGQIQHQLLNYLERAPELQKNNYYKFLATTTRHVQDLPLVGYYNAMMTYCAFMANVCPSGQAGIDKVRRHEDSDADADSTLYTDDVHHRDSKQNLKKQFLADAGMDKVAFKISEFCQRHIGHNGLLRFPRLQLTFALTNLCRYLPPQAAEILSRPLRDDEAWDSKSRFQTPVELVQQALEYLEENDLIEEDKPTDDSEYGAVQAASLEFHMYQASRTFCKCIKLDPICVDYHLWYIGALGGCLLLCSGNRMGSGARLYPSFWSKASLASSRWRNTRGGASHEVRSKLPKYEQVRDELACAIRLLLHNSGHQNGWASVHLAVSSVMEWKQVIGLLVGRNGQRFGVDDPWAKVCLLHQYHSTRLLLNDRCLQSKLHASSLAVKRKFDRNFLLSLGACDLENDPSELSNWRNLVNLLGPLGRPIVTEHDRLHKRQCEECSRLREMLVFEHDAVIRERQHQEWWAANRISWWDSTLLDISAVATFESRCHCELVCRELQASMPDTVDPGCPTPAQVYNSHERNSSPTTGTSWLMEGGTDDSANPPSQDDREMTFDDRLPNSQKAEDDAESVGDFPQLTGPNAGRLEILCYKLILSCHMYGVERPGISEAISGFILACWDEGLRKCDEWNALLWLSSRGLDVSVFDCGCLSNLSDNS